MKACTQCNGAGFAAIDAPDRHCTRCNGSGEEPESVECDLCGGLGYIEIDASPKRGPGFVPPTYVSEPPTTVRHGCQACGGAMSKFGTGRVPHKQDT